MPLPPNNPHLFILCTRLGSAQTATILSRGKSRDQTEVINRTEQSKSSLFSSVVASDWSLCKPVSVSVKMPETSAYILNGFPTQNGHVENESADGDEESFLFTSESVGEGHPGNILYIFIF